MKTLITLGLLLAIAAGIIFSINGYLSPDDLANCQQSPSQEEACQPADAVVVISGGDTVARTKEAIRLFNQGWAPQLIVSGAAIDPDSPSNAVLMRQQAIEAGIPTDKITLEESSQNTRQNAQQVAKLARQDWRRVIVVTSSYHERRAEIEFEHALPNVQIIAHPVATDRQWSSVWWLTLRGWWLAGGELVKILIISIDGKT